MSGGIFVLREGEEPVELREEPYDSEDLLQGFLAQYPNLLAGDQINSSEPRRWLLVTREVAVPGSSEENDRRWSLDHLFLDQSAMPTLVEVKRSSDTRIRRQVVGQMLEYAANGIAYWSADTLRSAFETNCERSGVDAATVLESFVDEETDSEEFWERAQTNLTDGRIRMVFVADRIPTELQCIVEFLNRQMDPAEAFAVEIRQFAGTGVKTLVPKVMGQTAMTRVNKRSTRSWDAATFFDDLRTRRDDAEVRVAQQLLEWITRIGCEVSWGAGGQNGSFKCTLRHNDLRYFVFWVWTSGRVEIHFKRLSRVEGPFQSQERRRELQTRLNAISGVFIPDESLAKRPPVPLSALVTETAMGEFLATMQWVVDELRAWQ